MFSCVEEELDAILKNTGGALRQVNKKTEWHNRWRLESTETKDIGSNRVVRVYSSMTVKEGNKYCSVDSPLWNRQKNNRAVKGKNKSTRAQ